jgi:hypothetical protein
MSEEKKVMWTPKRKTGDCVKALERGVSVGSGARTAIRNVDTLRME